MKNTLAMVQAIASQTMKGVTERDAVEAFARRIGAMGAAHDQLLQQDRAAASLFKVVSPMLELHGDGGRISTYGPTVELGPKETVSISLLLHDWRRTPPSMERSPFPMAKSICHGRSIQTASSRRLG